MRLPLLVVGISLVCSGSPAAQPAAPARVIAAEFPASEFTLLNVQQRGDRLTAAARALAREPEATETLARLIDADRIDDALGVAKRIVGSHPDRLVAALTLLSQHNSRFHDKARGHPDALAQIARDARRQLPGLPREDAARAARQIIMFEPRQPSVPQANAYEEALAEFLRNAKGTEAARLAEVDRMTRGRPSYQQVDELEAFAKAHVGTAPGAKALYSAGHQLAVNVPITGVEPRGSDPTDRFMRVLAIAKELESGAYGPDPAAALKQLTTLVGEPYDEAVCVAGIARATLLTRDRLDDARAAMQAALSQCRIGGLRIDRQTRTAFEADVVAVRNAVFKPLGGGILGTHGWDSYKWPASPPPFLLVSAALTVKAPGGGTTRLVVRDPVPGLDNVVYVSADQLHLLNAVMTALGGTKRFAPASIMSIPNQPAGAALDVLAFWKQFFPAMPGHWGGWELEAFPRIGAIEFLDNARTRAAVPVTIGYSGATIVLEKRQGVWETVELTNRWIT